VFGRLDRVGETETVVTQASTQALLTTLTGGS
jgi:hypothetical protein